MSSDIRLCEYFIITGLENNRQPYDLSQIYSHTEEIFNTNLKIEEDFFKFKEPIVDIQLVNLNQKEQVPEQYYVVEKSYTRQNKGFLYTKATNDDLYLCFRFGRDKPPIIDIWVQNPKQKITPLSGSATSLSPMTSENSGNNPNSWTYIEHTISRRFSASLNNSQSNPLYVCYKRASLSDSVDSLAVTDICVIVSNKNEQCPPAYTRVNVPIKRSTLGNTVNICYKKSLVKQHVLTYKPETIYCLPCTSVQPILDKSQSPEINSNLPPEIRDVANFCMPWGATIETWSEGRKKPKPSFLTFVLTDEKYNRMYGSAVQFYDEISVDKLTEEECVSLQINRETDNDGRHTSKQRVYVGKSICLLSRISSFTQTFNQVLTFLLKESYRPKSSDPLTENSSTIELPLERYISQFLHSVPFPIPETPNISLHWDVNAPIAIHLPHNALSQFGNGENLYHLIRMLEVDQVIQLFIYMLTEQKILLTSTCNSDLTGIAEALLAIIFPFRWSVTYIPFLYLSCIHIIQSPSPYLIGVDSRFFDYFRLPEGVGCVDLVTKSIKTPDDDGCNWKHLEFQKVLPSHVLSRLRNGLGIWKHKVCVFEKEQMIRRNTEQMDDEVAVLRKRESIGEMIRECFLKATISLFSNYQNFLIPLDLRHSPDNMFQTEAFLKLVDKKSRPLYQAIFDTQLWNNFVLSRSQSIKFDDSLVFFDRCIKRMNELNDERANTVRLIQNDIIGIDSEVTRVIGPPGIPENWSPDTPKDQCLSFPISLDSSLMLSDNIIHSDDYGDDNSIGMAAHLTNSLLPPSDSSQLINQSSISNKQDLSTSGGLSANSKMNGVNKSYSSNQLDASMGGGSTDFRGSNVGLDNANASDIPVLIIRPEPNTGQRVVLRRSSGMSILKRPLEELKQARQMAYDAKQQMLHHNQQIQYHFTGNHSNQYTWATQLLASSYCLWFLTLPGLVGHILDTPGLGETGLADRILQLSMELLGGLGSHGINLPDEVCCRIVMLLIHQLRPAHFRAADLRQFTSLNAFSYGLCNQITLEENQEEQLLHEMDLLSQVPPQIPVTPNKTENTQLEENNPTTQLDKSSTNIPENKPTTEASDATSVKQSEQSETVNSEQNKSLVDKSPNVDETKVPKKARYNKKLIGPDGEIEIGGKIVKLRGKKQTTIGYEKETNSQERDRKRKHDRFSVLLFQPMSFGNSGGVNNLNFTSLSSTKNTNLNNMTTIGEELSSLGRLHSDLQLVDKRAGLLMSSTTKSPQMIVSDDIASIKTMLTSSSINHNKLIVPNSQIDNKMKPPKLQMFKPNSNHPTGMNDNLNSTNINDLTTIPAAQSTLNTNPIGQAIIFKSPFSEERSEIHHSFLKTSTSTQDATKVAHEPSEAEKRLTGTSMVTDVIESLQECNVSAKSSEISYETGTDDRLTQSEFGSGNIANKTRASFRQMRSVANRSIRSVKNIMSVLNTPSTPENHAPWSSSIPAQVKQPQHHHQQHHQQSPNQRSGVGGGLPTAFRPWDSSKSSGTSGGRKSMGGLSFGSSSKGTIGQKDRRVTGSVDLLDRIPGVSPSAGQPDASYRPGLATVQQIRRYNRPSASSVHVTPHNASIHQYDSGRSIAQSSANNLTPSGGGWLMSQFDNSAGIKNSVSTDSIQSDPSVSSNSQESEPIIINLDNAWEQITGSLSAVLLPTGKYWSSPTTHGDQDNSTDNQEEAQSTPPSPSAFVTRECQSSLLVHMTTGSECPHCHQTIYDDSIMNGWSWEDSEYGVVCYSCEHSFTPKLKFQVYIKVLINPISTNQSKSPENDNQPKEYREILAYRNEVNYLSPFVMRKELESLLEKEGESGLLKHELLSKHNIYYWNLLWFFNRLSLPSQLPSYLTQWLRGYGESLIRQNESNRAKYHILSDLTGYEKVQINTFWEFSQLSSKYPPSLKSEWILYKQMLHVGAPLNEQTIFIVNIIKHIFDDFIKNDLTSAIVRLLGQRKMKVDYAIANNTSGIPINPQQIIQMERSIYRELYSLISTRMDPKVTNYDHFHQVYYEIWRQIVDNYRNLIGSQDKPPSPATIFCRKVYRDLLS